MLIIDRSKRDKGTGGMMAAVAMQMRQPEIGCFCCQLALASTATQYEVFGSRIVLQQLHQCCQVMSQV
jgi:hypothetical protein